jgi:hypothetical protein
MCGFSAAPPTPKAVWQHRIVFFSRRSLLVRELRKLSSVEEKVFLPLGFHNLALISIIGKKNTAYVTTIYIDLMKNVIA